MLDRISRKAANVIPPHTIKFKIEEKAWDKLNTDAQNGVDNILENQPVQILSAKEKGQRGIKLEPYGWAFITKTDQRLYASTNLSKGPSEIIFDKVKKGH